MVLSLRTTSYTAAIFIALVLGFLLLIGSRQYKSQKEYQNIIEQNEKIIFQFATIREHITESLLENHHQQLNTITGEIESLNGNISQILQQSIIPDEYRLSFSGQVDFAGIILLLRSIATGEQPQAKIRQLNQEIRILGERLMLFDRVVADHVKKKLVGFQSFVIGILAIILFIVIYILLFWQGQIGMPLIDLVKQAREIVSGRRSAISVSKKSGEIAELAGSFQHLLTQQHRSSNEVNRYNRVLEMVHKVGETVWQARNRDDIFKEACRAVLSNNDYVLTWIGIPADDNRILPVIANGSTTMNQQERDECMATMLSAAEENGAKYDAAHKALAQQAPVIIRDILAGLPKGPFKNTPFASGTSDCIALPLVYDQQVFGVMTIYSIAENSFSEEEVELLKGMSREMVFALFSLAAKESNKTVARLQAARKKVFENNADLILVTSDTGKILEANPAAVNKLSEFCGTVVGSTIFDIFPSDFKSSTTIFSRLAAGENIADELHLGGTEYYVSISALKNQPGEDDIYLLIARDISECKARRTETIKASKLAAMGEISVGVANEINNLTNGIINYSQILSEEIAENGGNGSQSIELLHNVINEGERISQIVQQLLFFNGNSTQEKEAVRLDKIIQDTLALTKHQFKYDAIDVQTNFPDIVPSVRVNVQEMQHVFLNILSNARYALNQRYPGSMAGKRLEIQGEIIVRNGQRHFRIICTDFGVGIHPNIINKVFEPFFSTKPDGVGTGLGLSICRSMIEDNNGTLEIESILDDHTSIVLELPATA